MNLSSTEAVVARQLNVSINAECRSECPRYIISKLKLGRCPFFDISNSFSIPWKTRAEIFVPLPSVRTAYRFNMTYIYIDLFLLILFMQILAEKVSCKGQCRKLLKLLEGITSSGWYMSGVWWSVSVINKREYLWWQPRYQTMILKNLPHWISTKWSKRVLKTLEKLSFLILEEKNKIESIFILYEVGSLIWFEFHCYMPNCSTTSCF